MSNTRKATGTERRFIPWSNRPPQKPTIKRRISWGRRSYVVLSDGSHRRVESDRMDRRELGLSPRQYRKAKRLARLEAS